MSVVELAIAPVIYLRNRTISWLGELLQSHPVKAGKQRTFATRIVRLRNKRCGAD